MTGDPPTGEAQGNAQGTAEALDKAFGCLKAGRVEDAAAALQRVLEAEPENPHAHHLQGLVCLQRGLAAEAAGHLERAVAGAPDRPDHHINLGVAMDALGRMDDAIGHYRRALALAPDSAVAYANLGFALRRQGDFAQALDAFERTLERDPEHTGAQLAFAHLLGGLRAEEHNTELEAALVKAFGLSRCNHAELAAAAAHQLGLKYGFSGRADPEAAFKAANEAANRAEAPEALGHDPLFAALMSKCVNTDIAMELFLTALRRRLLLAAAEGLAGGALATAGLLGLQCFLNEYVFLAEADELDAVQGLQAELERALAAGEPADGVRDRALVVAMYRPLRDIDGADGLAAFGEAALGPGLDRLVRLAVSDHAAEQALIETIETVADITDVTSQAVRAQYEENPYPRWLHAPDQQPQSLASMLAQAFPHVTPPRLEDPLRVLIAGAGTGQHVVHVARTHPDAEIVAIDLSKASLAYAMRMTAEMGVSGLRFLQADVLDAGRIGGTFDMIQSVGVLHHMKDPLAGWRVLAGLLGPGGVMKVGLYSERGRAGVRACRKLIADEGIAPTPENIARFRRRLITDPPADEIARVLETPDFHSTSMCRDLLFHVQEHHTTPKRLKADLDALGLEFIGFEQFEDTGINDAYRDEFPDDPALADLDNWEAFEARHGALIDLYLFWCAKPAGG